MVLQITTPSERIIGARAPYILQPRLQARGRWRKMQNLTNIQRYGMYLLENVKLLTPTTVCDFITHSIIIAVAC